MDAGDRSAAAPATFGIEFLDWFRTATERNWAAWQAQYFEGTEFATFGSAPWQQHARWLDGLSDDAIDTLERTWSVQFPPDWRLFLHHLHAPDRPLLVTPHQSADLPPVQQPFFHTFDFYNWLIDAELLCRSFDWPLEGLLFDLEHNGLWHESWGRMYPTLDDRKKRITELVAEAPTLIPILGHRYLLAEPCRADNPVLSIYQSDIVVYGVNLRGYLLNEFAYFLDIPSSVIESDDAYTSLRAIPFWGEFL